MAFLMMIGFLSLIFSIGYFAFHFIRKLFSKDKRFSRKIFYPCFIGGLLLLIITAPFNDQETYADTKKSEDLTAQVKELTSEKSNLQKEQKALKQQLKQAKEKLTATQTENETLKKENEKLSKEKDELTKDKTSLTEKLAKTEVKSGNAKAASKEKSASATAPSNNSGDSSENTAQSNQECKIKGSVNHIYHTPGSTYYNRTKNVVQWFCSEKEARAAGYSPPKR
ncbi:hypothetical protein P9D34_22300 [Bacillus swezeyi]|uniref:Membrane protein YttA n=1 Tax=Bacillus swezeyi TaxID=1925020 RepID=A0A1R1RWM4_9BACI|nr:hypothetical protein [Bacillus swezeyi]MEC1263104.1 hypothetical protein [Bacillus swezeyi]MED2930368.1 hypothetical protein [Bacillus swezeyi]MED2944561.1 hypothetical protein [Bacillus swezeyi]MED2963910.1 hypothetical protein [Bacillus swezeyi]MED2975162.1 hypothetical protein [Bacillus swezeyi]